MSTKYPYLAHSTPNGLYDWACTLFIASIVVALIDKFLKHIVNLPSGTGGGARWFALHSICNILVVAMAISDASIVLFDPLKAIYINTMMSLYPLMFTLALHVYHTIEYYSVLTYIDWLHHILMIGFAIPLTFVQPPSLITNAIHVFMMGIPGAIDYFMLSMVKLKIINSSIEKKINSFMNVWIRAPGIFYVTIIMYIQGKVMLESGDYSYARYLSLMLSCLLNFWNAFYFMERVVASRYISL